MDFKYFRFVVCSLLRSPSLYIHACALRTFMCRPCLKVVVSRLTADDGGDREMRENTGNSVEPKFEFLTLNYSEITAYFKMPFWLLVDNKYIYIMPEHQPPAPPKNSQTKAPPDSTCPCPNMFANMVNVQTSENCT